ncbi:MAG TPA: PQQ-binding-like beta-propeller repeat protein [Candidatus Cybelea sp.]|nr:PQQ-binding-like beta-propeller repeat protein [Candidatus Cybelea sp.]
MLFKTWLYALAVFVIGATLPARATDWPLFDFDSARSGFNPMERTLTVRNVHRLRVHWQTALGAVADSAPILLDHVGTGRTNGPMLFETTTTGITLGIGAMTGRILWKFESHGTTLTNSTPAADPSGLYIYAAGADGKVYKLSAATGRQAPSPGFPARITHLPLTEKNSSALNVANGYLYAVTAGHYDTPPYDGHVVAVRLSDGQTTIFNTLCSSYRKLVRALTCSQQRSGIWGRGGAVVDPDASMDRRIYVTTGNGDFDANSGGDDYGDSVVALQPDLSDVLGSYTPTNYQQLDAGDTDLGSSSPAILPDQPNSQTPYLLVQGGKDGVLRLLNRQALPGVGNELQELDLPGGLFSTPAVWADSGGSAWIFMGFTNVVEAYRLETGAAGVSKLVSAWQDIGGESYGDGSSPVVANGIVFVAFDHAILAVDARNGRLLWNSAAYGAPDSIGAIHWESPIVVNGWLYCSDQRGVLTGFSLQAATSAVRN